MLTKATYVLSPVEDRLSSTTLIADCGIEDYMFSDEDYQIIAEPVHTKGKRINEAINEYLYELKELLDALIFDEEPKNYDQVIF